jgi:hypothetical protein
MGYSLTLYHYVPLSPTFKHYSPKRSGVKKNGQKGKLFLRRDREGYPKNYPDWQQYRAAERRRGINLSSWPRGDSSYPSTSSGLGGNCPENGVGNDPGNCPAANGTAPPPLDSKLPQKMMGAVPNSPRCPVHFIRTITAVRVSVA